MAEQPSDKTPIAKIEIQILCDDIVKVFLNGKLFHIYSQCTVTQRKEVKGATEMKRLSSGVSFPFGFFTNVMEIRLLDELEELTDVSP